MNYKTIPPPASLAKYVRFFWVFEGEACREDPYIHRGMPDGCAELVFHYRGVFDELFPDGTSERSFTAGLDAQSQHFRRFSISQNFGIFGVYLYPFAVTHLFSIPSSDLKNQMLDIRTLFGKDENGLEEKMMMAPDLSTRVHLITHFLESRLGKIRSVQPGVFETMHYIIETNGTIDIAELARRNFLSRRQFERNFKQFSGFSPKVFARIIRFQNSLKDYGNPHKSLTQIGLDAGYADQSHFIREFKEFSGYTPKEYFLNKGEGTEWREA